MSVTLPDEADAWAERLQARVNDREAFAEAAAGFDATFRFEIVPDDAYEGDPLVYTVVVADGGCAAAFGYDGDADYDFVLQAPYGAWRDLLEDEMDVAAAVMGGPFDLEGSRMRLLDNRAALAELVRAARSVDTEFAA